MPLNSTGSPSFILSFDTDEDVDYIDPAVDATASNATTLHGGAGATVAGGSLILDSEANDDSPCGLQMDPLLYQDLSQKGCFRFKIRFTELLFPFDDEAIESRLIFWAGKDVESPFDTMRLAYRYNDEGQSQLYFSVTQALDDNDFTLEVEVPFTPVLNQTYEVEINFNFDPTDIGNNFFRWFIDGQLASGPTELGERHFQDPPGGPWSAAYLGGHFDNTRTMLEFDYFAFFPTPQHTGESYLPDSSYPTLSSGSGDGGQAMIYPSGRGMGGWKYR